VKSRFATCIAASIACAALATPVRLAAQEQQQQNTKKIRYTLTNLGPATLVSGGINHKGWVAFSAPLPDGTEHASLWREGVTTDLGTLGGPNSNSFGLSKRGQVVGKAETSTPDPLGEDFCFHHTNLICLPFVWQNGVMTPLPILGGHNATAFDVNNRGEMVGNAEKNTPDPTCPPPQVLQSPPVIWENGVIRELPTVSGDPDGVAFAINDNGEAVGASGANCTTPFHALLWRKDGSVRDLGNLGGTMFNIAQNINNRDEVVGASDLAGDTTFHAFLWTQEGGMQDLGTLGGLLPPVSSWAFAINDKGQVVGFSCDVNFDCVAFVWQDGAMLALNNLIPPNSGVNLIWAYGINARGEIALLGDKGTGTFYNFVATPCDEEHANADGCQSGVAEGEEATRVQPTLQTPKTRNRRDTIRWLLRQQFGIRYQLPAQ
jgi:probable HAF family extracellular repeat protein